MFKKQHLALAIAATLAAGAAQAALETSVTLKNETARFIKDGIRTGEATTNIDTTGEGKTTYKFENTAKIYLNDELDNGMSWHGELNIVRDTKAINDYKGHETNTQRDWLRELYIDTTVSDWDVRLGKQQVVWGTADGIKLLDNINPTDWSEFNQNAPADARIPVWMVNAEKYLDNGANIQVVLSQAKENKIAGLNSTSDAQHPFLMKGVDTITGKVNGFYNIVPALGLVSDTFYGLYGSGAGLNSSTTTTVSGYVSTWGYAALDSTAQGTNSNVTRLTDATSSSVVSYDISSPDATFEYMSDATFATFDTFVNATSTYVKDMPDDIDSNLSLRFRDSLANGSNYSLSYSYAYDPNPFIELNWKNSSGEVLETVTTTATYTTVDLKDSSGNYYGGYNDGNGTARVANLEFREKLGRIHNLGASFDTTIDSNETPVVLRGEFLYQKDVRTPVIDRNKLAYGDLVGAMQAKKGDYFKYVIGADVNVLTDMLLSGQFIQFRNLDYIDNNTDSSGSACSSSTSNCGIYTGDMATLHLTNNLQKAEKNKNFYSVFLSKPFGESGEGRFNNIFIYEEGGGKWNRFDVEYGFDDQLIGTFEVNKYFGDNNTMFGQFENASNVQIGVKYLLQ